MRFIITYGGGLGPDVWDAEIIIEAESIRDALDDAELKLSEENVSIFSIEQED